ncbi:MAG: adenylosuccinate synthetase [Acetatifactor sp.]|nr:adenylosuccinate synthetase [Acetatifactor sp.]
MREAKAVIGKNFGDEGKGQTVDLLCRNRHALVVRHNGGAQAGHTVEEGDFRFVFHQLGSGSRQGCPTFWSRTFLPDLFKLGEEMEAYRTLCDAVCASPVSAVYADLRCACPTIYDVLLNSLTEQLRGKDKHGSCGMGIYETLLRTRTSPYGLFLQDFQQTDADGILQKLLKIRDHYTKARLAELQAAYPGRFHDPEIRRWVDLMEDDNLPCNAAHIMCENFHNYVIPADWPQMAAQYDTIVFENAQGLLLDWDNEEYSPHLTASHTGLKNVAELLRELEDCREVSHPTNSLLPDSMEIIYVSRSYVTRHGAGRLDYDCAKEDINPKMTDRTNLPNPWQDALRYARHPAGEDFFHYIRKDLTNLEPLNLPCSVTLSLTHLNETHGRILFADQNRSPEALLAYCEEQAPGLIGSIRILKDLPAPPPQASYGRPMPPCGPH